MPALLRASNTYLDGGCGQRSGSSGGQLLEDPSQGQWGSPGLARGVREEQTKHSS